MNIIIEFWKLCTVLEQCVIVGLIGVIFLYLQNREYLIDKEEMILPENKEFDLPMFKMKRELKKKIEAKHDTRRRNTKTI